MYGHEDAWSGGHWVVAAVMMVLFLAALVALVLVLVNGSGPRTGPSVEAAPHETAERILNERFARGEIDEEEFVRRRDTLRSGSQP